MIKTATFSLVAGLLAATAGAAHSAVPANPGDEQTRATIRVVDLDLTAPADAARFRNRVRSAANRLCGTLPKLALREQKGIAVCHHSIALAATNQVTTRFSAIRRDEIVRGTH